MKLNSIQLQEFDKYVRMFDFSEGLREKTILITGIGGMTGFALVNWLLTDNAIRGSNNVIYASTRNPEQTSQRFDDDMSLHFCEYGCEDEILKNIKLDVIIHCAAPTGREFFINKPVETFCVITGETEKLLRLAQKNEGCKFIYLSSMNVYGALKASAPVSENYVGAIDSLGVRSGYPLGKKAAEYLCAAYYREYGVDTRIVRPCVIQGLTQSYDEKRVVNEIVRCLVEKRNLVLHSNGSTRECFIYTLDVITAIFTIINKGKAGEVYNVANKSTYMSVLELAERIFEHFNPDLKVVIEIQSTEKSGYLPDFYFVQDTTKIESLGWKPLTPYERIYEIDYQRFKEE